MRALVLRVLDAIRRFVAGSPPTGAPAGRVAHPQHGAGADHPHRTTWNRALGGSHADIDA